jgi:hypothetical protein
VARLEMMRDRPTPLEQSGQPDPHPPAETEPPPDDPLLSRLALLLEDF